jgi:GT2 family glycosyltransferase/lipopolysaccharide/colanic/teichoic acid biosynthesis glycosyltransferase
MDLSVIIVNYNVRQFLENALSSIERALRGMEGEVFVVDNASDDGSAEMVRAKFPGVHLIENRENIGFSRANNQALSRARGELLLLINPDTIVQEETFRVMQAFFHSHPDAGLAGCKILNPDGSFQLPCRRGFPTPWVAFTKIFGLSTLFPGSRLLGRYNLTYLDPEETYPVDAVSGSFMMIRREVYEGIGGLDEAFFMYGEDLDWCYRVRQAGSRVYYVHDTAIVHFKGESTRRSNIDELRYFYEAMELFVEKHISRSGFVRLFLKSGILLRGLAATIARAARPVSAAVLDFLLIDLALFLSAFWYFGSATRFTFNAHPLVWVVPPLILVSVASAAGLYSTYRHSTRRAGLTVIVSYLIISALVFFAKDFAYSRLVVVLSGFLTFVFVPGWRLLVRLHGRSSRAGARPGGLFGSRTLVVGAGPSVEEIIRKLRQRVENGYQLVGVIDVTRRNLGEKRAGIEIIGSLENIAKVIQEYQISDVIFAVGGGLSYAEMLSVIARNRAPGVTYRLVPNNQEAILGKTRIDDLEALPLVDIEYNLQKPWNRFVKRAFDLMLSLLLLPTLYLPVRLAIGVGWRPKTGRLPQKALFLPSICKGRMSFVGLPFEEGSAASPATDQSYLGKPGLTGLLQINDHADLLPEERVRYTLYYAKNQSLSLDLEILLKDLFLRRKRST